jgi:hypothetical protein
MTKTSRCRDEIHPKQVLSFLNLLLKEFCQEIIGNNLVSHAGS